MKGLDTNVLVRYLVQDDPAQAAVAVQAIETGVDRNDRFLIQPVVLCETVWVLDSVYGCAKEEILHASNMILRTAQFEIAEKDTVWQALSDYQNGKADFSDYLIGRANTRQGAAPTLTFDRSLKGSRLFHILQT
jgi:predicted nucleic-acid-binding protein